MNRLFRLLLVVVVPIIIIVLLDKASKSITFPATRSPKHPSLLKKPAYHSRLLARVPAAKIYATQKDFSTHYIFLVDMGLPSGQNRFFIYDLQKNSVLYSGLVAHGSCNTRFLETARFSNTPGCGCSSVGRYRVGGAYKGRFGKAFKLYGLDSTNSHAFERAVVLHGYGSVPDTETYPLPICNSLGCTMVSHKFLSLATGVIEKEKKPVLLWVYE